MNYEKLDSIFSKLKILGKLEPGEKVIFQDHTIDVIDFSTYNLGRIKKWYHDETRVSIRQKLKDFYRDIEDLTTTLLNNPPNFIGMDDLKIILDRLLRDLKESTKGVHNLILTYNEDKTTRSELETVLERVQIIINKISNFFKGKFEDHSFVGDNVSNTPQYKKEREVKIKEENKKTEELATGMDFMDPMDGQTTNIDKKVNADKTEQKLEDASNIAESPEVPKVPDVPKVSESPNTITEKKSEKASLETQKFPQFKNNRNNNFVKNKKFKNN